MAVNRKGQSILEVIIVLPFLFMFVGLLFKMNMGIQMAINNVQIARSQIYKLTVNSPEYPRIYHRKRFGQREQDLMILGVSDPSALLEAGEGDMPAIPQLQKVGRRGTPGGSEDEGEMPLRTTVRIRETSAICTQINSVNPKVMVEPAGVVGFRAERWPFKKLVCQYNKQWIGDLDE